MRVLVFGDSITQGYWDTEGGWVERIRRHYDTLQASDLQGRSEPTIFNLGISADNSKNILDRIESEVIVRTRHNNLPVIIIQIGVNDSSFDDLPEGDSVSLPIGQYKNNLRSLINKIKPLSSKIIFVGLSACDETQTTPVSWGNFHYTNEAIKNFENVMKNVANDEAVSFIPVFDSFNSQLAKGKNLLLDGLHPNNEGHAFISDTILSRLVLLLAE